MIKSLATVAVVAVSAAFVLPGCTLETRHSTGHVSTGVAVEAEFTYTYFPSHHAYYREQTNDWWVMESGSWAHYRHRPSTVVIHDDTPWLVVNVRGDAPHIRNSDHHKSYSKNSKGGKGKGPPPGRGWRK